MIRPNKNNETAKLYEEIRPCTKKHQEDTAKLNEQAQNGYWGDMGDGTYRNPIIAADFSDPDPIRVGDDFYMVTSTFETSPGVTVLHSKDLVNWEIIGAVFDDLSKVSPAFSFRKCDVTTEEYMLRASVITKESFMCMLIYIPMACSLQPPVTLPGNGTYSL